MEEIKDNENIDKIKIFSSEDDKLKILGELLSNKSSRDIIRLLIEKEMYTNEIAKKLELKPNLVIHHLQKMESIGLLEITNKKITKKGEEHRFFRILQGMLIIPNEPNKIKENGFLRKIFKEGVKFASIGIAAIISFVITEPKKKIIVDTIVNESSEIINESSSMQNKTITHISNEVTYSDHFVQILSVLLVIGLGLFLIIKNKKINRD